MVEANRRGLFWSKAVKGWLCPSCDAFHLTEDEPIPEEETRYQCGECEELYEDREKANECCKE